MILEFVIWFMEFDFFLEGLRVQIEIESKLGFKYKVKQHFNITKQKYLGSQSGGVRQRPVL